MLFSYLPQEFSVTLLLVFTSKFVLSYFVVSPPRKELKPVKPVSENRAGWASFSLWILNYPLYVFFHTLNRSYFPLCSYLAPRPLTCQQAKEPLASWAVSNQQSISHAPAAAATEFHVYGLRAKPDFEVAELDDWVAVPLLQPIRELAFPGRREQKAHGHHGMD